MLSNSEEQYVKLCDRFMSDREAETVTPSFFVPQALVIGYLKFHAEFIIDGALHEVNISGNSFNLFTLTFF